MKNHHPKSTSSILEIKIDNISDQEQLVQVWQEYTWQNSESKVNPPLKLQSQSRTITKIIYPTPNLEGIHYFQIKLLNQEGIQIKDQSYELEIEVRRTSKEKILSIVSKVGELLVKWK